MYFVLVILVSVVLVPVIYWYYLVYVRYASFRKLPGPKPIPVLGSLMSNDSVGVMKDMQALYDKYKPRFVVWTGPQVRVFHSNSDHLGYILNHNVNTRKSDNFGVLKGWIGDGLATSSGDLWKERRRLLNHSFNMNLFDRFMRVFNGSSDELNVALAEHVGEKSTDLIGVTNYAALDIACDNLMGVKLDLKDLVTQEYIQKVKALLRIIGVRVFSFWKRNENLFLMFSSQKKAYLEYCNVVKQFTIKVLDERIKDFKQEKRSQKYTSVDDNMTGKKRNLALIDILLEQHEKGTMSYRDICEEIDTFLVAGHETSAGIISFALFELARHPECQQKLYEEIMTIVPTGDITQENLNDLVYTDMVIREALRMYPQVPFMERQLDEPFELDGIYYPKDTVFGIPIINLHYDPEYFPNPHEFDPERFTPENYEKVPRYVYLPFSAGPRICIGYKYAMWSAKVTLAKVVREFQVYPVPGFDIELEFQITLKSTTGVRVRLEKRPKDQITA